MVTTFTVLNSIGWLILISSWLVPRMMKDRLDRHYIGGILAAVACGIFVSALIVQLMK